ncbi:hypothetical protein LCGC14_1392370, partial [marine sediment metagenome]
MRGLVISVLVSCIAAGPVGGRRANRVANESTCFD